MKTLLHYILILFLWLAAILLWVYGNFAYLFWLLIIVHFMELLLIGLKTGKKYGIGSLKSILMCMLFGYSWWLPLSQQIKAETYTHADFIRKV